jgi:hypothetical protein
MMAAKLVNISHGGDRRSGGMDQAANLPLDGDAENPGNPLVSQCDTG